MYVLELTLFLSCLPALAIGLFGVRLARFVKLAIAFAPAILLLLLTMVGGGHALNWPLYLLVAGLGCAGMVGLRFKVPRRLVFLGSLCGLAVGGWGVIDGMGQAASVLPPLSGPHPVGGSHFEMTDSKGVKLRIYVWYPTTKKATGCLFDYEAPFRQTRAMENAPVAPSAEGWPVVLYCEARGGKYFESNSLCETLASEGFVVLALDCPIDRSLPALDFRTEAAFALFRESAAREIDSQTTQILQLFAVLPNLRSGVLADSRFKDGINPANVGVLGYSFGGAVAAEACLREPKLKAGVNLDGTLFGQVAKVGAPQPFLFVTDFESMPSEGELHSSDGATRRAAEFSAMGLSEMEHWLQTRGGWLVQFDGVRHDNFSDGALHAREPALKNAGRRDAKATAADIHACVVAFFRETLEGKASDLLRQRSPWPGVEVRRFPPTR